MGRYTVRRTAMKYEAMPWLLFDAKARPIGGIQLAVGQFATARLARACAARLNKGGAT